jgi:cytochrome b
MTTGQQFRVFHAGLALAIVAAYLIEHPQWLHDALGYLVALLMVLRLLWSWFGPPLVRLGRYLPSVDDVRAIRWFDHPAVGKCLLTATIAALLIATVSGIAITPTSGDLLRGLHEATASATLLFVALHVAQVLVYRRRHALAMVFLGGTDRGQPE